jgi:hypothetical protein
MSKESNNIRKLTPAEELKALLSEDPKAKKKMQKIFSLIDKSANIDDTKFNQELSKAKKLAYEKGARIDYNPQEGFRDLSVVTELGNKLDKNKYKPVSVGEIKNIIETAPDKKPSYYKQDEQDNGAKTTADSIENPKPKKTVSFGDKNGLKIDVRETKSKDFSNTKIDYDTLKLGNEKAHTTNLEHKLERFVTVFNVGGLRQEIENMVVQYTIAQKNDNVIKNTAAALAKWNVAKNSTLIDVYDQVKTKKDNDVKEDIPIYRESIENNLKEEGASKIVIKDVLNEFDKSITQPINSANNKDSIAVLASKGFQKFGDIIGAPPRIDDRTARIKKINQKAEKVQDTPQPKAENNIGSRVSELQSENQKIDAELQEIATSKAQKRFGRFNIPLIRKERNLKKEKSQNSNLIQGYEKIVQPTLSMQARKAQKMFAEVQSDKALKSTLEKEKMSDLIQNKINKIKETSVNPKTQELINDIVKTPEVLTKPKILPMGQRRPVPARKFLNQGRGQNPQAQTSNAVASAPLTATSQGSGAKPTERSNIPKSRLSQKQASQNSQKIRVLRGSVELPNNNPEAPDLNTRSAIPAKMAEKRVNLQTIGSNFQEKSNNNIQPKTAAGQNSGDQTSIPKSTLAKKQEGQGNKQKALQKLQSSVQNPSVAAAEPSKPSNEPAIKKPEGYTPTKRSNIPKSKLAKKQEGQGNKQKALQKLQSSVQNPSVAAAEPSKPSNEPAIKKPEGYTPTKRSNIPKSKLAKKQVSQNSNQILALRGSVGLSNNNIASPDLSRSSSLPNMKISDGPLQSTQNPSVAPKDIPNPQVNDITLSKTQQESVQLQTQKNASIQLQTQKNAGVDALWAKLERRENTRSLTKGTTKESSSADKMAIMHQNIEQYKEDNLNNKLNKSFGLGMQVDEKFENIKSKDTKVIEFSSKALEALKKDNIKSADIKTAYKYLKRIDNVDNPGLLEKAVTAAKDKILQQTSKLAQNIPKSPATNQQQQNEKPGAATNQQQNSKPGTTNSRKSAIIAARNIGNTLPSQNADYAPPQHRTENRERSKTQKGRGGIA